MREFGLLRDRCMSAMELRLSDEDRQLLLAHYPFYHALDTGERVPSTDPQRRFVAVCCGAAPSTSHELAFTRLREFLRMTGVSEQGMVSSGFSLSAPPAQADPLEAGVAAEDRLTEEALGKLTPRKRAILKLRSGCQPLAEAELAKVPLEK
jgi:hypothetical protein